MHYVAGWPPCTPTQETIRFVVPVIALLVLILAAFYIFKLLRSKGRYGWLLATVAIFLLATVVYIVTVLMVFYFAGFCV